MRAFFPASILVLLMITAAMLWMTQGQGPDFDRLSPAAGEGGLGKPAIGGDFELVNQDGQPVKDAQYRGKYMLVFFGFTACPDICPTGLGTMTQALSSVPQQAQNITPIFITVDPERDTPAVMKDYLKSFYATFTGLTGTKAQVEAVEKAYKVYAAKVSASSGGDYTMDHSGYIYLMDTKGEYVTHFPANASPQEVADNLKRLVK